MTLNIGDEASRKKIITGEDIDRFAEIIDDYNPIHLDEAAAEKSVFGKRIAHGFLSAGLISGVLGSVFPGPGTIYISQDLHFVSPVFINDEIEAKVVIEEILNPTKGIYKVKTQCINQSGVVVVDGEAVIKYKGVE